MIALLSSGVPATLSGLPPTLGEAPQYKETLCGHTVWCNTVLGENTVMADESRLVKRAPLNCPVVASARWSCMESFVMAGGSQHEASQPHMSRPTHMILLTSSTPASSRPIRASPLPSAILLSSRSNVRELMPAAAWSANDKPDNGV